MAANILHQLNIKNTPYWTLKGCDFTTDGVKFRIVGSTITGDGPYEVLHTIKNIEKNTYADISMNKLIQILLKSE